jgi:hypothetical protein
VPHEVLVTHGAVSAPTARAMAAGARASFGSDWGIGITGIAGPTGGTADKPVGLVHWAVAGPAGITANHRVFSGDRPIVRLWSVHFALDRCSDSSHWGATWLNRQALPRPRDRGGGQGGGRPEVLRAELPRPAGCAPRAST